MSFLSLLFYICIPILLIFWIWAQTPRSRLNWSLNSLFTGLYLTNLYLTGAWPFFNIPLIFRYLFVFLFVFSLIRSFPLINPKKPHEKLYALTYTLLILLSFFFSWEIFSAFRGKIPGKETISLTFPLNQGNYYVLHGGSTESINHHHSVPAQQFALDIVKLSKLGIRSHNLIPTALKDYCIFAENLFSPINGTILKAEDTIQDATSLNIDPINPAGNHLVIQAENSNIAIILAHLMQNSLQVKEGDKVSKGQLLGKVGNSGNTSEPHLHIHAVKINSEKDFLFNAEGVSILFEDAFLTRNSVYNAN